VRGQLTIAVDGDERAASRSPLNRPTADTLDAESERLTAGARRASPKRPRRREETSDLPDGNRTPARGEGPTCPPD